MTAGTLTFNQHPEIDERANEDFRVMAPVSWWAAESDARVHL